MGSDFREYFRQLYQRLNEAVNVPFRRVHLDGWKPSPNKCHGNVDHWVKHRPESKAVRGWIFWPPDETGRCRLMAHSVIQEKSELFDITPIDRNTPREALVFLRHLGTEGEFEPMKTACSEVVYPPVTWEEVHDSQSSAETDEATETDS